MGNLYIGMFAPSLKDYRKQSVRYGLYAKIPDRINSVRDTVIPLYRDILFLTSRAALQTLLL